MFTFAIDLLAFRSVKRVLYTIDLVNIFRPSKFHSGLWVEALEPKKRIDSKPGFLFIHIALLKVLPTENFRHRFRSENF